MSDGRKPLQWLRQRQSYSLIACDALDVGVASDGFSRGRLLLVVCIAGRRSVPTTAPMLYLLSCVADPANNRCSYVPLRRLDDLETLA